VLAISIPNATSHRLEVPEIADELELKYRAGEGRTRFFDVHRLSTENVSEFQLRTTIRSNFANVAGFVFCWTFADPTSETYERTEKMLHSLLIGTMLVIFALDIEFDLDIFTQLFLLLLLVGVAGVFASNPIGYLLAPGNGGSVTDPFFGSFLRIVSDVFCCPTLVYFNSFGCAASNVDVWSRAILCGLRRC
jgi:hypothetical protein